MNFARNDLWPSGVHLILTVGIYQATDRQDVATEVRSGAEWVSHHNLWPPTMRGQVTVFHHLSLTVWSLQGWRLQSEWWHLIGFSHLEDKVRLTWVSDPLAWPAPLPAPLQSHPSGGRRREDNILSDLLIAGGEESGCVHDQLKHFNTLEEASWFVWELFNSSPPSQPQLSDLTVQIVMLESADPVAILSSLQLAWRPHTLSWWASSVFTHSLVLMVHSFTKPSEPLDKQDQGGVWRKQHRSTQTPHDRHWMFIKRGKQLNNRQAVDKWIIIINYLRVRGEFLRVVTWWAAGCLDSQRWPSKPMRHDPQMSEQIKS